MDIDTISADNLKELVSGHEGPCVSIYMPTDPFGKQSGPDRIRFKDLLRKADEELGSSGLRSVVVKEFLGRARALIEDGLFWQHQSGGLAVFIYTGRTLTFRQAYRFDELSEVMDGGFEVRPLISALGAEAQFHILALSQNRVRLLQCTRTGARDVDLRFAPDSLAAALRFDDLEKQSRYRMLSSDAKGGNYGMSYGEDPSVKKEELLRFFQQINGAINDYFGPSTVPLMLAGVDYLLPIYRKANTYNGLLEDELRGNTDEMRPEEISKKAWPVIEPVFGKKRLEAAERFDRLLGEGSPRAARGIDAVLAAALHGRVESLFVSMNERLRGTFDEETGKATLSPEWGDGGARDLLGLCAIHTFINRGSVYCVGPQEVPGGPPVSAVLRY